VVGAADTKDIASKVVNALARRESAQMVSAQPTGIDDLIP
jgi:hypothetical protein